VLVLAVSIFSIAVIHAIRSANAEPMDCTAVELTANEVVDAISDLAGTVSAETEAVCKPDPPRPDDLDWCVTAAAESQNLSESWLYAVGEVESNNEHYYTDGTVKRGDGGRARGWGQIHLSPWQQWAADELERDVDLDVLEDNVMVCAMILRYYLDEYDGDLARALGHYNGGPYNSKGYARKVMALLDTEECETETS